MGPSPCLDPRGRRASQSLCPEPPCNVRLGPAELQEKNPVGSPDLPAEGASRRGTSGRGQQEGMGRLQQEARGRPGWTRQLGLSVCPPRQSQTPVVVMLVDRQGCWNLWTCFLVSLPGVAAVLFPETDVLGPGWGPARLGAGETNHGLSGLSSWTQRQILKARLSGCLDRAQPHP